MYQIINQKAKKDLSSFQNQEKGKNLFGNRSFKIKIISAWKYPGISPKGKSIPIPEEILEELSF